MDFEWNSKNLCEKHAVLQVLFLFILIYVSVILA